MPCNPARASLEQHAPGLRPHAATCSHPATAPCLQDRLELLAQLLQKEQKLLQTIDRLRLQASDENREKHIRSMLQLMSSPKRWQMSDGEVAQVHTPFTTRAKELTELYNGLMLPQLTAAWPVGSGPLLGATAPGSLASSDGCAGCQTWLYALQRRGPSRPALHRGAVVPHRPRTPDA